jgi:hypothetical protein
MAIIGSMILPEMIVLNLYKDNGVKYIIITQNSQFRKVGTVRHCNNQCYMKRQDLPPDYETRTTLSDYCEQNKYDTLAYREHHKSVLHEA